MCDLIFTVHLLDNLLTLKTVEALLVAGLLSINTVKFAFGGNFLHADLSDDWGLNELLLLKNAMLKFIYSHAMV